MPNREDKLKQLHVRLENLAKYETAFKREIADIRREIILLKGATKKKSVESTPYEQYIKEQSPPKKDSAPKESPQPKPKPKPYQQPIFKPYTPEPVVSHKPDIEQFVGKYLISIIGVLVTVIGVGIGAKYAIDNNWITPLMRIVFGYAVGIGLVGFAVYLKEKYHTFSAVLLSGGMAIMYFVTFFAYSYYSLLSQLSAFSLMVIFTVFTVISAIIYDRRIIAHIGLVGAYAVPFLLSEGSGRVGILFSFIAIINVGILAVSLYKYWKYLFYSSFIFTWLIYAVWYLDQYKFYKHFSLSLIFLTVFFAIFYLTFLAYKLIHKKPLVVENIALILVNSFIFFGLGYAIINDSKWDNFLGLFTVGNAFIHFVVATLIHKYKLGDKNTFHLVSALVLIFLTLAVPIQLEGNWITLIWIIYGVFLFAAGRTKKIPLFEYLSYALMVFASLSQIIIWQTDYLSLLGGNEVIRTPLFNENFVTSLSLITGLAAIYFVDRNKKFKAQTDESIYLLVKYAVPSVLLIFLYNTFRLEIVTYFDNQSFQTAQTKPNVNFGGTLTLYDDSLSLFSIVWQLMYTAFFLSIMSYLNIKKIKNWALGYINLGLNSFVVFLFITVGLFVLELLRSNYYSQIDAEYFSRGTYHLTIRYFTFLFLALLIFASYKYIKQRFISEIIPSQYLVTAFETCLCFVLLVIFSSELIFWTYLFVIEESDKFGLSILWGVYALVLIAIGILQNKIHLRVFAISLFAITLIKLFIYDIANLDTISKTIVFVLIGVLLLIASFLYNKYAKLLFETDNESDTS